MAAGGTDLAVLVPNSTETHWFQRYCFKWEVLFIKGRVTKVNPTQGSALVLMGPRAQRGRVRLWAPAAN